MQALGRNLVRLPTSTLQQYVNNPVRQIVLGMFKRGIDTLYTAETCEDCVQSYRLPTVRKDLKRMDPVDPYVNKDPCWQSIRRTEYKCRTDPEFMVDAFVDKHKKCLGHDCLHGVPRFDETHYRPSDKLNRKYHRTWVKCVPGKRKVKTECYLKPVRALRRTFKREVKMSACLQNPCHMGAPDLGLSSCSKNTNMACQRISMPFCKPSRVPAKCSVGPRGPKKCQKRLTKYPSFSECLIDPLPSAPPMECNCLETPSMCTIWEYFRNKKS